MARGSVGNDDLGNFLGLTDKGEAWKSGLTGEGVVVGVIDTGIWPEHPSFADDGTCLLTPADDTAALPCDFGNTAPTTRTTCRSRATTS